MSADPEAICREIYAETRRLYADRVPPLSEADRGFRVLYGPPVVEAPILFLGFQPGGHEAEPEQHDGWPAVCDYTVATWTLARRLREVFGADTLARCTGLNRIFFRSPSVAIWRKVKADLREELEAFSLARAERIAWALRPQRIVVIGLGTLAGLAPSAVALEGENRILVRRGNLWGAPAYGMVHLSGARVSRADLERVHGFFEVEGLVSGDNTASE